MPLILAFYCIVGGGQRLPDLRRDLYTRVLRRMLTGRWRGSGDRKVDADTCLRTLRTWAWSGASTDPVSDVGAWVDDIPTELGQLDEAHQDALDHVATPLGLPDLDSGKTLRRFIHRSIREHLVAEHVASLPTDQAAQALLPHIWYDPDWEYAAPAAIAMHPHHDRLLRDLTCLAARSDRIPGDLSVIDAGWEFRGFLARVAAESNQADWSPGVASVIGRARVELARSTRTDDLSGAHWHSSNRQARAALLKLLARETASWQVARPVSAVTQLATTAGDKRQVREALLRLLASQTDGWSAYGLAHGVVRLDPTAEDKRQAREAVLRILASQPSGWLAFWLVPDLAQLEPTAEDKSQAREALLRLLASENHGFAAAGLVGGVTQFATTAEDKRQARAALLELLASQTDSWVAAELAAGVAQLDPTAEDKRQASEALLRLLARNTDGWLVAGGQEQLATTREDKRQARDALLRILASQTHGSMADKLAYAVARLTTTAGDKRQASEALLRLLARCTDGSTAAGLAAGLAQLDPTDGETRQAREK